MHSFSAEVNNGYNASAAMKLTLLNFLGFMIFIEETKSPRGMQQDEMLFNQFQSSHFIGLLKCDVCSACFITVNTGLHDFNVGNYVMRYGPIRPALMTIQIVTT